MSKNNIQLVDSIEERILNLIEDSIKMTQSDIQAAAAAIALDCVYSIPISTRREAMDFAIQWQKWANEQNFFYEDLIKWQVYFKRLAKDFGLTEDFEENGII